METIQYIWNCHGWMLGVEHSLYTYWLTKSKSPQHEIWMKYGFENWEAWGHTALIVQMGETEEAGGHSIYVKRPRNLGKNRLSRWTINFQTKYDSPCSWVYLSCRCKWAFCMTYWAPAMQWLSKPSLHPPWSGVDVLGGDVGLLSELRIMKSEMSWDAAPDPTEKKSFGLSM